MSRRSRIWVAVLARALRQRLHAAGDPFCAARSDTGAAREPHDDDQALREARLPGLLAIQISEVIQNNVQRRVMLRERLLTARDHRAGGPWHGPAGLARRDDGGAASIHARIRVLDQAIAQQAAEVSHHLAESRRLRAQARAGEPV